MKWSPNQLEAINTINKSVIVSASAGAGKTTVLIARIMKRIIQDKVPLDRIIAMTFTEAAAAEMKKRLADSLHEAYKEDNSQYLYDQIALIPNSKISTIHSFCLDLIKDYYYVLGIDPRVSSNILDEATSFLYQEEALNTVINNALNTDYTNFYNLNCYLTTRVNDLDTLKSSIKKLAQYASSSTDPNKWLDKNLEKYLNIKTYKQLDESMLMLFNQSIINKLLLIKESFETLIEYNEKLQEQHILFNNHYSNCITQLNLNEFNLFRLSFKVIAELTIPRLKEKDDKYSETVKVYQSTIKEVVALLIDESDEVKHVNEQLPILTTLVKLTKEYIATFSKIKLDYNAMDFNDMEIFAYRILSANNNELSSFFRSSYDEIMVDEFQDTNILQNEIVNLISKENNSFKVGDIKQSIYRFRGAKPSIMKNLIDENNPNKHIVYLSNNYRSKNTIIDFTNMTFNKLLNIPEINSSYTKQDTVTYGTDKQLEDNHPVSFSFLKYDSEELDDKNNQIKADYIASQIIQLKEKHNYNYKDFVILVRSHSYKAFLKEAFEKSNIPHFIPTNQGFYQSSSVSLVIALLQVMLDPNDDINLVAVLVNIFDYSNNDLANIKLNMRDNQSYYSYLKECNEPVIDILHRLFSLSNSTLSKIIRHIFTLNNFYDEKCDIKERTNLDYLYEKALLFEDQNLSIISFIDLITKTKDEKVSEALHISEDDDVVKVMTIHQSKGLQFPVVFLWSSLRATRGDYDVLICDDELGFSLDYIELPYRFKQSTIYKNAINYKTETEELAEQIRLLYVALTRAQNQMFVIESSTKDIPEMNLDFINLLQKSAYSPWLYNIVNILDNDEIYKLDIEDSLNYLITESTQKTKDTFTRSMYVETEQTLITPSKTHTQSIYPLNFGENRANIGTMIHETIELLPSNDWTEELILSVNNKLNDMQVKAIMHLYNTDLYTYLKDYTIQKEVPFIYKDSNKNIVNGIIDMLVITDNTTYIIDFKTDQNVDESILVERYTSQLKYYEEAISVIVNTSNIKTYIYSFYLHRFVEVNTRI